MRDKLIELLLKCDKENDVLSCYNERPKRIQAAEIIADHLLENSVIVQTVKLGDTVWFELYGQIEAAVVYHCTYESSHRGCILSGCYAKDTRGLELSFNENSIGKGVFLTREEAERALKGGTE